MRLSLCSSLRDGVGREATTAGRLGDGLLSWLRVRVRVLVRVLGGLEATPTALGGEEGGGGDRRAGGGGGDDVSFLGSLTLAAASVRYCPSTLMSSSSSSSSTQSAHETPLGRSGNMVRNFWVTAPLTLDTLSLVVSEVCAILVGARVIVSLSNVTFVDGLVGTAVWW